MVHLCWTVVIGKYREPSFATELCTANDDCVINASWYVQTGAICITELQQRKLDHNAHMYVRRTLKQLQ